jgi:hypothetical protein
VSQHLQLHGSKSCAKQQVFDNGVVPLFQKHSILGEGLISSKDKQPLSVICEVLYGSESETWLKMLCWTVSDALKLCL